MWRRALLPLLPLVLTGCASLHNPLVRADFHESAARGAAALAGSEPAFERLAVLEERWKCRGHPGWVYRLTPWERAARDRAAVMAADLQRVRDAREAILAQHELASVMGNALRDLEDEYEVVIDTMEQDGAAAADMRNIAEQKYLARRMAGSLALMSSANMADAVQAADLFGRDVNRFQKLLDVSINGDEESGIEPPANPDVEDSLAQIEELFAGYVADSAPDILEYVVARYDAWLALNELAAQDPAAAPVAATQAEAASDAAAGATAEAAEDAADDAAAPEPADESSAGEDGAESLPEDEPAEEDLPADDEDAGADASDAG